VVHDAAGNITSDGTNTYTYSDRGRLATMTNAGGTVTYSYNALEMRVGKTGPTALVPTGASYYVYDEEGKLLGEYDANGVPVYETIYMGAPVGVMKQTGTAGASNIAISVYNVSTDQLGAPRIVTRQSDEAIAWRWDSAEAFGATAPDQNPGGLGVFSFNQRFPGQVFDAESGLLQNWNREYNPRVGRYMQADPVGFAGGINTYAYVNGDPLTDIDPMGLWAVSGGFNLGPGLQMSFGRDDLTNRPFFDLKFGWGLGVTAKYDPLGGLPHSVASDCGRGGFSIRDFLEIGKFVAGPIDTKLIDAKAGYNLDVNNFGRLDFQAQRFAKFNPKAQAQGKVWGLDAKLGAVGVGVTMYTGSNDCTCQRSNQAGGGSNPGGEASPTSAPRPWTQADFLYGRQP